MDGTDTNSNTNQDEEYGFEAVVSRKTKKTASSATAAFSPSDSQRERRQGRGNGRHGGREDRSKSNKHANSDAKGNTRSDVKNGQDGVAVASGSDRSKTSNSTSTAAVTVPASPGQNDATGSLGLPTTVWNLSKLSVSSPLQVSEEQTLSVERPRLEICKVMAVVGCNFDDLVLIM
jgi:hypothetical protein